ncbi:hypothetical protein BH11BAC1_BH11BAC1_15930 [soil metagenome]
MCRFENWNHQQLFTVRLFDCMISGYSNILWNKDFSLEILEEIKFNINVIGSHATINKVDFYSGLYFVKIQTEIGSDVKKLVVE